MRIAQIAPLAESVPPSFYGGTERIVAYLTDELVAMGHDVTLFASGDSVTEASLVAACGRATRLDPRRPDPLALTVVQLGQLVRMADRFDILHFHTDLLHFPVLAGRGHCSLTTLHGRLDNPGLAAAFDAFPGMPLTSISLAQRAPQHGANWVANVPHGLPIDLYQPGWGEGAYLAFLGRISRDKRVDRAIEISRRLEIPLRIAAKVDSADLLYFEREVRPLLDNPLVTFIGEIEERKKSEFLGKAAALLFPIDWPEPFGLVMIEAMACATPVVAWRCGSVGEVVDHGVTGFIVDSMEQATAATARAPRLDRTRIRRVFEKRFSARRMAAEYLMTYLRLMARNIDAGKSDGVTRPALGASAAQHRA